MTLRAEPWRRFQSWRGTADLEAFEVRSLLLLPTRPDSGRSAPDFEHVHRELAPYQKMRRPN